MKGATVDNVIVVTPGELRLRAELSRLKESMAETGELFLDAMGDAQVREARLVEVLRPLQLELAALRHRVVVTEALADVLVQLRAAFSELGEAASRDTLEAVVGLALTRIDAVLEANPEVRRG
jgi:hypothetical protein